jgi:hypothetical protein
MKKVTFNDTLHIIFEPVEKSYDLHRSRISDYRQRQVDHSRMEKLLTPILSKEHRDKIYTALMTFLDAHH